MVSNPFNIANIEAIVMARDKATPRIRFVVDVAEVTPTPQASALIVQRLLEQLGFGSLLSELGLDKNHGVAADSQSPNRPGPFVVQFLRSRLGGQASGESAAG